MFSSKKATSSSAGAVAVQGGGAPMCVQGDSGLVLTTDPKPRLRWTVELHERFVDAVAQLGGPDSTAPKPFMCCALVTFLLLLIPSLRILCLL